MSDARDPYEVLGVPRTASTRRIRAAYVERARQAHPDLVGIGGLEVMRGLNEAWDVLKDADRRAAYDEETGGGSRSTGARDAGQSGGAGRSGGSGSSPSTGPMNMDATADRPFWTGAAGRPPGRPSGSVLDFGIYAGWSLGEIFRVDRGYLQWLRDKREASALRDEITKLIEPLGDDSDSGRRRFR